MRQIARNAGHDAAIVLDKVLAGAADFGFNADTASFENLVAAGIIDPTKVVRLALHHAASVAGLILTTEVIIAQAPERRKTTPQMPADMG